ncbi:Cytochrome P450 94A1 [Dendrobium catenatum]|uniref:noroxomaritidine synthase n=1 Tax=Dendrobium catenatum TaxID=906689 RepID=A0A2I0XFX9_9ASPA|nr:Cytochrome P450 94A1 [Dendrobium catenatum]
MEIDWAADLFFLLTPIPLAFISAISIYLLLFFLSNKNFPKKNSYYPPGLQPYPIIGHLPQFLRHRDRFLEWSTDLLAASPTNTLVFHRPGGIRGVITANPANVEHMLKSHFDNYPKGDDFRAILHDFLGRGIFNSDGALWRLQRKTASFEFNTRSLRFFVHRTVGHEISTRLIPFLHRAAEAGGSIDLQDALERFAFDNICKVAFDVDPAYLDPSRFRTGLASGFAAAFGDAAELSAGRFRYAVPVLWRVKKAFDVGSERRLRKSIAIVHEFAMQIIRSRKKAARLRSGGGGDDLLSRFIVDEENNSDEFLRDIIISFILAGRETTSSALTWFFWLLSSRPDVERHILAEVAAVRKAGCGLGLDELRQMHYLHAAVTEAMRLSPPVPFNSAVCCADEVLPDGTEIKKGSFLSYNAYAMGRMEGTGIWGKDGKNSMPERWLGSTASSGG